jgi:hypothetical protein
MEPSENLDAGLLSMDVDLSKVSSPVLARIIDEVRNEEGSTSRNYDRVHNRHNR